MTPDEIHAFLAREYPQLTAENRTNPDGWSFFLGAPNRGPDSNRILRAVRNHPNGVTHLKLSVTSRHQSREEERDFGGDESALRRVVDGEIELFRNHFEGGPRE